MPKLSIIIILTALLLISISCDSKPPSTTPSTPTKAPDFTLKDLNYKEVRLAELIGPKPLVIDFWASWCQECVAKLPKLMEIYNNHKDSFNLVGINLDRSLDDAQSYTQKKKIDFMNLYDEGGKVARIYNVFTIPTVIIINSEGEITNNNASLEDIKTLTE